MVNTVLSLLAFIMLFDGVLASVIHGLEKQLIRVPTLKQPIQGSHILQVIAEESISGAPTLSLLFVCALCIICHLVAIARYISLQSYKK